MYKPLIAALVVLLSACGTIDTYYSTKGTWKGSVVNKNNPSDIVRVKFILNDEKGRLSGTHYFYNGYWKYLGVLTGEHSENYATGTIYSPGGTFSGNSFTGTYYIYLYSGGNLDAVYF